MSEAILLKTSSSSKDSFTPKEYKLVTEIITENTNWRVPLAKNQEFYIKLFGGGGAGAKTTNKGFGGGGSPITSKTLILNNDECIDIQLGKGGTYNSTIRYGSSGGTSAFGNYFSSSGGLGANLNSNYTENPGGGRGGAYGGAYGYNIDHLSIGSGGAYCYGAGIKNLSSYALSTNYNGGGGIYSNNFLNLSFGAGVGGDYAGSGGVYTKTITGTTIYLRGGRNYGGGGGAYINNTSYASITPGIDFNYNLHGDGSSGLYITGKSDNILLDIPAKNGTNTISKGEYIEDIVFNGKNINLEGEGLAGSYGGGGGGYGGIGGSYGGGGGGYGGNGGSYGGGGGGYGGSGGWYGGGGGGYGQNANGGWYGGGGGGYGGCGGNYGGGGGSYGNGGSGVLFSSNKNINYGTAGIYGGGGGPGADGGNGICIIQYYKPIFDIETTENIVIEK